VSVSGGARFFFSFSPPPRGGGGKEGGEREAKWWRKERNARLAGWPAGAKKQSTGARAGAADCSEKEGGAALEEIGPGSYPRLLLLEYFIVMWIEESGENSNDVLLPGGFFLNNMNYFIIFRNVTHSESFSDM
jgi:hypothetical protein